MGRILAIDYGKKRTGLAWTDPLQIIASGIGSIDTETELESKLKEIIGKETIDRIVLGYPTRADGSDTHATQPVRDFQASLAAWFPDIPIHLHDERYTSKIAMQTMIETGVKKKQRCDKQLINQVSAVIILQEYLGLM
jgi:putative Holliday junction resolvase